VQQVEPLHVPVQFAAQVPLHPSDDAVVRHAGHVGQHVQAVPVHPHPHVCATPPCTPHESYQYRFPPEHAL